MDGVTIGTGNISLNHICFKDVTAQEDDEAESPLRSFILNLLVERKTPVESNKMGPKLVWETYCDEPELRAGGMATTFRSSFVC